LNISSKGLPSEDEAKKRQRLQEMKDYEHGKKVLSPSIFRKSKGPIIFAASSANFSVESTVKSGSLATQAKKGEGIL